MKTARKIIDYADLPRSEWPEIISRKESESGGLKRCFNGRPCKWGHVTERYVSGSGCLICCKQYQEKNREKIRTRAGIYRDANREKLREGYSKHYYENRNEILDGMAAHYNTPEQKARRQTPEYKAHKKAYRETPSQKANAEAYRSTPEWKASQKVFHKAHLQARASNPEMQEKRRFSLLKYDQSHKGVATNLRREFGCEVPSEYVEAIRSQRIMKRALKQKKMNQNQTKQ